MRSLRRRLHMLTVSVAIVLGVSAILAVARLRVLEDAVTSVLSRNYRSIEAAEAMAQVVGTVQRTVRDGRCSADCPRLHEEFRRWLAIEHDNYTEPGEQELTRSIDADSDTLFATAARGASATEVDRSASALLDRLAALVALNKSAMFAADRHTRHVANRLVFGVLAALGIVIVVVIIAGWRTASALADGIDRVLDEEAKTGAVIESIDDGVLVLDPAGVVRHVNEVAEAILGLERGTIVGRRFDDLDARHPHYLRVREAARAFLGHPDTEPERVEVTLFLRGRDHHYVLRPARFRARDGSPGGFVLVLQDVTHLRDQEAHREHLVATLSHELRSPLTSLRMALDLLQTDPRVETPPTGPILAAAREDVARLTDLADRLLDVSRSRATSIALEREAVDLGALVVRAARLFELQAREKSVTIEVSPPAGPLTIDGDPTKLTWAVSNLLANALRYTPRGGHIRVDTRTDTDMIRLSVHDSGPGIPAAQRERIFQPFTQSADGGETGAAGLGLAIVRDIVQAHGGRILLDSTPGAGSCFTLALPRSN